MISAIPQSGLSIASFAATYRHLAPERSARAGLWDNSFTPYLVAIMDAVSDPAVKRVVFMASSQIGKTEVLSNVIAYFIALEPAPILFLGENQAKVEAFSKESFAPMVRVSPILTNLVEEARSRDSDNTITSKKFPGGAVHFVWATSAAQLSSRPIRILLMDEVDAYKSGTTEGDPIRLARARLRTFPDAKEVMVSSPRDEETSIIKPAYENSYKGKYWVPCPSCNEYQVLQWRDETGAYRLVWDADPRDAVYSCVNGCVIEHDDKQWMLQQGEWRFEGEFKGTVGFWLNEMYSPFPNSTWGDMAVNFLEVKNNRDGLRAFINTSLSETWKEDDAIIEVGNLPARCEDYGAEIPAGVIVLTAAADVQGDRLEYEIIGWGLDHESWRIKREIIWGDPAGASVWEKLRLAWTRAFTDAEGREFTVKSACVDSGGHHTQEVYEFCRRNAGRRWFPVKGSSSPAKPLIAKPALVGRPAVRLFVVGTETAKDAFSANLRVEEPGPGYCHFPDHRDDSGNPVYDEVYFQQLVSEKPIEKYVRGVRQRVWIKIKQKIRNEALDIAVYSMAAYAILNPNISRMAEILVRQSAEKPNTEPDVESDRRKKRPKQPSFVNSQRKSGGFVRNWR